MSYTATIRDRRTGESAEARFAGLQWGEGSWYWWALGNYSCDCNREIEFLRAKGLDPDPDSAECHHDDFPDGRFEVVRIAAEDGSVLYTDAEGKDGVR